MYRLTILALTLSAALFTQAKETEKIVEKESRGALVTSDVDAEE